MTYYGTGKQEGQVGEAEGSSCVLYPLRRPFLRQGSHRHACAPWLLPQAASSTMMMSSLRAAARASRRVKWSSRACWSATASAVTGCCPSAQPSFGRLQACLALAAGERHAQLHWLLLLIHQVHRGEPAETGVRAGHSGAGNTGVGGKGLRAGAGVAAALLPWCLPQTHFLPTLYPSHAVPQRADAARAHAHCG